MDLGAFSVSLAVKDLEASKAFYEKLGFRAFVGEPAQNWLILKNGHHVIGLFQGMFERNMLTFNPGWNDKGETLESFTDIRKIQRQLARKGIEPEAPVDESGSGPASILLKDPDGNPVLIDQHV